MTDRINRLRAALEAAFTPSTLHIEDDSRLHAGHASAGKGGHYRIRIISTHFAGKNRVQRHQVVFAAAAELMGRDIHALSIDAKTPEETAE